MRDIRSALHDPVDEPAGAGVERLARLVRARLAHLGWSLQTAAEESGLSVTTIWALREGSRGKHPRPETLLKLAVGLNLTAEDIFEALDDDDHRLTEQRHLHIYRRLDRRGRQAVDALALRLLGERAAAPFPDEEDEKRTGAAEATIDLTAVRALTLPLQSPRRHRS